MYRLDENDILFWLNNLGFTNALIEKIKNSGIPICDLFSMQKSEMLELGIMDSKKVNILINNRDYDKIMKLKETYNNMGISIVTVYDSTYPDSLNYVIDKPNILYYIGKILPEDFYSIAIVGSRKTTEYGKEAATYFSRELSKLGITIISGMANGVDSFAHIAALKAGGRTLAVLGTGVNIIYPRKNTKLYEQIIENGAVISEYPINTSGKPFRFPERNRIVSGLSLGVIIVEAQQRSGSLITARQAAEQGREVFAVPGNINSLYSKGTNELIRDGATLVTSWEQVVEEIDILQEFVHHKVKEDIVYDLTMEETVILKVLEEGETGLDALIQKTGLEIQVLQSFLTILELKDLIKSTRVGTYIKKL